MARRQKRVVRFVDLFCGAGGLAEGFREASNEEIEFQSVFAVEIEESFAASYEANFGKHVFKGPIGDVKREHLPDDVDLVVGGPPCQGFSPLGKMTPRDEHAELNRLWKDYFRIVAWLQPKVFVIENVPEFLKSSQYVQAKRLAQELGYDVDQDVLNAWHFGVPQVRRRGFVVGVLDGVARLPTSKKSTKGRTVKHAIRRFLKKPLVYDFQNGSSPREGYEPHRVLDLHIGRTPTAKSLERYKWIPPGGNRFDLMKNAKEITPRCWLEKPTGSTDVFGRLEWDKPSVTIRTEFFKPEKGRYLHPQLHRPITHLEAAKLQTFPDDYLFCGSKIEIARQIGNAVPPKLAKAVAQTVGEILLGKPVRQVAESRVVHPYAEQLSLY